MLTPRRPRTEAEKGFSPLPLLYARSATGALQTWRVWTEGADVCTEWGVHGGALQRSRFTCEPKNVGRSNATTAEQQAIAEAIALWKKRKKQKYHEDPKHFDTTLLLRPMLAEHFLEYAEDVTYPLDVQPKLDGFRCLAFRDDSGKLCLTSRKGEPWNMPHIVEELEKTVFHDNLATTNVLDGELYVHGLPLQTLSSLIRRQQEGSSCVEFHCYDAFRTDAAIPWDERRYLLRNILPMQENRIIKQVITYSCRTHADVMWRHRGFRRAGYEGTMIRLREHEYRIAARSSGLLKLKDWQDEEFVVVDVTVGRGKAAEIPKFVLALSDGKTFEAVPLGTAEQRRAMLAESSSWIGRLATVRFQDYSPKGVPLYPRLIGLRED